MGTITVHFVLGKNEFFQLSRSYLFFFIPHFFFSFPSYLPIFVFSHEVPTPKHTHTKSDALTLLCVCIYIVLRL